MCLTQVQLGLLEKGENKSEQMLQIFQHWHAEYVPSDPECISIQKKIWAGAKEKLENLKAV